MASDWIRWPRLRNNYCFQGDTTNTKGRERKRKRGKSTLYSFSLSFYFLYSLAKTNLVRRLLPLFPLSLSLSLSLSPRVNYVFHLFINSLFGLVKWVNQLTNLASLRSSTHVPTDGSLSCCQSRAKVRMSVLCIRCQTSSLSSLSFSSFLSLYLCLYVMPTWFPYMITRRMTRRCPRWFSLI